MRRPKGFGKNYFSLSAICAYSSNMNLQAQCNAFIQVSRNLSFETLEEEEKPLEELEALLQESAVQPQSSSCHCNCFFKNRLYTLCQVFKYFPQTFFIFFKTHSGISPPTSFLTSIKQNNILGKT